MLSLCRVALPPSQVASTLIPEHLLYWSQAGQVFMWWQRGAKRRISIAADSIAGRAIVPMPSVLFAVVGGQLHLWALKGNSRPTADTMLYHSPFFNIYEDGKVCTGDCRLPKEWGPESIAQWEHLFWESDFTDHLPPFLAKGSPHKLWKKLLASPPRSFPKELLAEYGTVGELIQRLTGGQR